MNLDAALRRRNYTLGRMADVGYITAAEAEEAKKKPIVVRPDPPGQASSAAPYFLEEVRSELEGRYGAKQLYENGLSIQTALDLRLQEAATAALDDGLRRIDKRRGFRKPRRNVVAEGHTIETFRAAALGAADDAPARSCRRSSPASTATSIQLRVGHAASHHRSRRASRWTGKTTPAQLVTRGDLIETRLARPCRRRHAPATGTLEQAPAVEGAVLAIDNTTGQVAAMVGGYSFERSKFNRATQAIPPGRLGVQADSSTPRRSTAATRRSRVLMDTPVELPRRRRPAGLRAAELRPQVRGPDHAAPRARAVAQRAGGPGDGATRARSR